MQGFVLAALERHVRDLGGDALAAACFPRRAPYAEGDAYPDADVALVAAAWAARQAPVVPVAVAMRSLGEAVPAVLRRTAPASLPGFATFAELLDRLLAGELADHPLLARLVAERRGADLVVLVHRGEPAICRFDEGVAVGLAALAGEGIAMRHPSCRARGDDDCLFVPRLLRSEATQRVRPSGTFRLGPLE
jgi:hypothetical protein